MVEVSFEMAEPETYETAKTWREAVEQELDGLSVSNYDNNVTWSVIGPGDLRFWFEGAELDDPISSL
jgi:hypothetical protein